jgi:hypothetical protein
MKRVTEPVAPRMKRVTEPVDPRAGLGRSLACSSIYPLERQEECKNKNQHKKVLGGCSAGGNDAKRSKTGVYEDKFTRRELQGNRVLGRNDIVDITILANIFDIV